MVSARNATCTTIGTKREHFAHVAISFREHALRNPAAMMKKPLTLDDYYAARMIAEPYGVYDCSLLSDGAGAAIVTSAERARDFPQPLVYIKGFGSFTTFADGPKTATWSKPLPRAAARPRYRMAGIGPQDIDTAQLYDCFTGMVGDAIGGLRLLRQGRGGTVRCVRRAAARWPTAD